MVFRPFLRSQVDYVVVDLVVLTTLTGRWPGRSGWSALGEHTCQIRQIAKRGCKTLNEGGLPVWHEYPAAGMVRADTMADLLNVLTIRPSDTMCGRPLAFKAGGIKTLR
jgi:hypothetical protein